MSVNKENLSKLVSSDNSSWKQDAADRKANQAWKKRSVKIAVRILSSLKAQGISQRELAERMNVSSQYVSKIIKGSENLSLETISGLEAALNINVITVSDSITVSKQVRLIGNSTISIPDQFSVYIPIVKEPYIGKA